MEAGVKTRRDLILLAAFTLLLHAPFLNQPVQGDEVTYLDIARHVLQQPLRPLNFQYVFLGHLVNAAGHPHPPLNAYLLALAWILRGHFSVVFFHAFIWCLRSESASPPMRWRRDSLRGRCGARCWSRPRRSCR